MRRFPREKFGNRKDRIVTRIVCKSNIDVGEYESFLTADDLPAGDVAWLRDSVRGNQIYKAGMWRAGVSECPYYFAADETFVMIEGVLQIMLDDGQEFEFRAGDTGSFELGTHSTWKVVEPVLHFFIQTT